MKKSFQVDEIEKVAYNPKNKNMPEVAVVMKERNAVVDGDKWNVEAMFASLEEWQKELEAFSSGEGWKPLLELKGCFDQGAGVLKDALDHFMRCGRLIENFYVYAHLRNDEDVTHEAHRSAYGQVVSLYHQFSQQTAWVDPEILSLPEEVLSGYMADPSLKEYHFYLEKVARKKEHTLPAEQEALLALSGKALQAAPKAFRAMNDADFKFGTAIDQDGEEREISHGSYGLFIREQDRTLRESAFKKLHGKFQSYENTLSELLGGVVESHLFQAKARKHTSCMEASLFEKNIDPEVYRSLIRAVNENLDALHRYMALRKKMMGVEELHLYDVYVPLTKDTDLKLSYEEAAELVVESVAPLGKEYQDLLRKGLMEEGWVDRYENRNKRSGAYSSGSYDSLPYILMNYKGVLRDVFTLAHEAGHSMHSLLSHSHQSYTYGSYPIFLAEVASTFNEELLGDLLKERYPSKEHQIFLINERLEDVRATLFRQTMFAEFELMIHEMAEKNEPHTPGVLKEKYRALCAKYFGEETVIDEEIAIEWARIPHFYYNFYVYQYATGISAALALCNRVKEGGDQEREDYLNFLKGGSSEYPLDLLKKAGVDMRSPEPVAAAIQHFREMVEELEGLLEESPQASLS